MDLDYKVIGIAGSARSGKDTLGENFKNILCDAGIKSETYAFADELKLSVDSLLQKELGISAFTEDSKEKSLIRPFLVFWGTEVMRKQNDNVWIEKLEGNLYNNQVNIITDMRFMNELDWIKKNRGLTVFIDRVGAEPANDLEAKNNEKLSKEVDVKFEIGNFDDPKLIELAAQETLEALLNENIFKLWKATCHS